MFSDETPVESRKRLATDEVGHGFRRKCDGDETPPRKPYPCCAATDQAGDTYQHLREQYILTAEYVALAYLPITQRREMATGHVVHVHKVEPGVDKGRDAALGGFDDDPACRRGSHIARADWRRGIDDHGGKASFRHHGLHQSFGRDFAALVGADPLLLAEWEALVRRGPIGSQGERRNAAGVDDALDARPYRLLHEVAGPFDVHHKNLGRVARPEAVIGRYVKNVTDAGDRALERFSIS